MDNEILLKLKQNMESETKVIKCDKDSVKNHYQNKDLLQEIVTQLDTIGRSNGLKGFELVKKVKLVEEAFSIDNNLITPTLKLKRTELKNKYLEDIKKLYEN